MGQKHSQPSAAFKPQQVQELQSFFHLIEKQLVDGKLDRQSFNKIFRQGDDTFADRLWRLLDRDQSGCINFQEYVVGTSVFCTGSREDKLRFIFSLYDQADQGYITFADFQRMTNALFQFARNFLSALDQSAASDSAINQESQQAIQAEIERQFKQADTNRDNKISLKEFMQYFETNLSSQALSTSSSSSSLPNIFEALEERIRNLFIPSKLSVRVAVVGPAGCGKSTIVQKFVQEGQGQGTEYKFTREIIVDGTPVNLEVIDSDSQNRTLAYPGADVVVAVIAVDSKDFAELELLRNELSTHCPNAVVILAVTKVERRWIPEYRAMCMTRDEARAIAEKLGARHLVELSPMSEDKDEKEMQRISAVPTVVLFEMAVSSVVPPFILRPDHLFVKVGLVGPKGGGRTTLLCRLMNVEVVASFSSRTSKEVDGLKVLLELNDSDDYNRKRALVGADVVLLVFPVNHLDADSLQAIVNEVRNTCHEVPLLLVGTKADLRKGKTKCISVDKGESWAREFGAIKYLECSATENANVNNIFEEAVRATIPLLTIKDKARLTPLQHSYSTPSSSSTDVSTSTQPGPSSSASSGPSSSSSSSSGSDAPAPPPPLPPRDDCYVALYDYTATSNDQLSLKKFDVITQVEKDDSGWWKGVIGNRAGLFPGNYVQLVNK
jgi:GTPase SAR1 family protein/Ca2+-binding EF-hand superfamily protein